jgi:hypothetical protein
MTYDNFDDSSAMSSITSDHQSYANSTLAHLGAQSPSSSSSASSKKLLEPLAGADEPSEFMKRVIAFQQTEGLVPVSPQRDEDHVMGEVAGDVAGAGGAQQDEDVLLATFLLSNLKPICSNCGSTNTPQWRKGWWSNLLQRSIFLCNACGLRFHKVRHPPITDHHVQSNAFHMAICFDERHRPCGALEVPTAFPMFFRRAFFFLPVSLFSAFTSPPIIQSKR